MYHPLQYPKLVIHPPPHASTGFFTQGGAKAPLTFSKGGGGIWNKGGPKFVVRRWTHQQILHLEKRLFHP